MLQSYDLTFIFEKNQMKTLISATLVSFLLLMGCGKPAKQEVKELTLFSARKSHLIDRVCKAYEEETGVKINYITDKAGPLLQKIVSDGVHTKADMLMTVDVGNLWLAQQKGILESVKSETLEGNIPSHLRDPNGTWFGLTVRARTIVYNTNKVKASELKSYEDLAAPKWKGRVCLRTSKKVYNQSLVAMMIHHYGEDKTKSIVEGWVNNLAADVFMKDSKALAAVAAGQGDVAIVNTYYYGQLMQKKPDAPLKIFWPNQDSQGVHINISGAGVVKASKNKKAAIKFLEWLSAEKAQTLLAQVNLEYPVNDKIKASEMVQGWGAFKQDSAPLVKAGENQTEAVVLMDKAGYK